MRTYHIIVTLFGEINILILSKEPTQWAQRHETEVNGAKWCIYSTQEITPNLLQGIADEIALKERREQTEYRAYYDPAESPDLPYQAQYYSGTTYHADGYERGGWYATEAEAIEGAKRGKQTEMAIKWIIERKENEAEE